jgi:hypothetical protein
LVRVVTSTRSRARRGPDLLQQIVDLPLHRPHVDRRIHEPVGRMICSTTTPATCSS